MKVRRVQDLEGFRRLAPIWQELARESGQASPFLSHDWFECCWRAVDPARRPEVLVVEDTAGPVGLVPLAAWRGRHRGLPVRCLGLLDSPDTPFADWLVVGQPDPVVAAVMGHLAGRRDWDVLSLDGIPAASHALKALESHLPGRFRCYRAGEVRSPSVDVTGTWEEFWAGKSQRFKKTYRNVRNRLRKAGRVSIEEHRSLEVGAAVLDEALDVSERSWKGPRQLAMATMPRMREFFRGLSARASTNGWLRLWVLRLDGRAVATEYQLEADGRVHALRADFDASLPGDLSPGTHLSDEIVRALFGCEGVHEYDMGPGDNEYKSRWATGSHETVRLRVLRPGLLGASLYALESTAVPALRRLRGRSGA